MARSLSLSSLALRLLAFVFVKGRRRQRKRKTKGGSCLALCERLDKGYKRQRQQKTKIIRDQDKLKRGNISEYLLYDFVFVP
jgi:hypothetical protein